MRISIAFLFSTLLCAASSGQTKMFINRVNGTIDTLLISDIKSMTFRRYVIPRGDSCLPQPPGMIAWWKFDGTAVDTLNLRNGSLQNGATFGMGVVNNALDLDGYGGAVVVADTSIYGFTSSFSIVCWVKLATTLGHQPYPGWRGAYSCIVEKGLGGSDTRNYGLYFSQTAKSLYFNARDLSGTAYTFSVTLQNAGVYFDDLNWHHLVAVWDRSKTTASILIDGQVVASALGLDQNLTPNQYSLKIGVGDVDRYFLPGSVDELSLFARALSESEVLVIYNAGSKGFCR